MTVSCRTAMLFALLESGNLKINQEAKKMENNEIILQFNGTQTIKETYAIKIHNIMEAVTLAVGNKSLLREIELDLMDALARVRNLQSEALRVDYGHRAPKLEETI